METQAERLRKKALDEALEIIKYDCYQASHLTYLVHEIVRLSEIVGADKVRELQGKE